MGERLPGHRERLKKIWFSETDICIRIEPIHAGQRAVKCIVSVHPSLRATGLHLKNNQPAVRILPSNSLIETVAMPELISDMA